MQYALGMFMVFSHGNVREATRRGIFCKTEDFGGRGIIWMFRFEDVVP